MMSKQRHYFATLNLQWLLIDGAVYVACDSAACAKGTRSYHRGLLLTQQTICLVHAASQWWEGQ